MVRLLPFNPPRRYIGCDLLTLQAMSMVSWMARLYEVNVETSLPVLSLNKGQDMNAILLDVSDISTD